MTTDKRTNTLAALWRLSGLPPEALAQLRLTGPDPVFPSSFAVAGAAQASIAAAALAACELGFLRSPGAGRQAVAVDAGAASVECLGWFSLEGQVPELWDPFSGLYRCADGWVRVHANFAHHRDGALRLAGLDPASTSREAFAQTLAGWRAADFEQAAAQAGLVATMLRSFDDWDASPQGRAVAAQPLLAIERIGDAPPRALPALDASDRPLAGLRVLDLTRILAGPVGGRALAAFGAEVMLVNGPGLPNIAAIADTSRGKRSAIVDLRSDTGRAQMNRLIDDAHVFVQGYRPGALDALGLGAQALAERRPGLICVSLSAWGDAGPWSGRRGFDSLVQTAMGFNQAEGEAAAALKPGSAWAPRALPMQILDQASGFLIAFGAAAALHRQQREGGSWQVRVSLAQTGHWLRGLGRIEQGLAAVPPPLEPWLEASDSGFGRLLAARPAAQLSRTPAGYAHRSVPPGTDPPQWLSGRA